MYLVISHWPRGMMMAVEIPASYTVGYDPLWGTHTLECRGYKFLETLTGF